MSELKTLKEIFWLERLECCGCGSCSEGLGCDLELIKIEAIKWIKDMQEKNQIEKLFSNSNELFYAIEKFKQFFNLTEEDLI